MSKFIEAVAAKLTGQERPTIHDLSANLLQEGDVFGSRKKQYRIGVTYERFAYCEPSDLRPMIDNTIRALKQEVYGDLRGRLIALERAVYEHDHKLATSHIRDLIDECFG